MQTILVDFIGKNTIIFHPTAWSVPDTQYALQF